MGRYHSPGRTVGLNTEECFPHSRVLMQSSLITKGNISECWEGRTGADKDYILFPNQPISHQPDTEYSSVGPKHLTSS